MHASVGTEVKEMRMAGKIVLVTMLEHKQSARLEQRRYNERRQGRQLLQRVRRIGKNQIVAYRARLEIAEHIAADKMQVVDAERLAGGDDEVLLGVRQFDRRDLACSARDALQTALAKSVVGRAVIFLGGINRRPLNLPLIILIIIFCFWVPDVTAGCGGESGGNSALYVARRHLLALFAERAIPSYRRCCSERRSNQLSVLDSARVSALCR